MKIVFLLPNTTSLCQPLDQSIIHNFELAYRKILVKRLLWLSNNGSCFEDAEKNINLTSALIWISALTSALIWISASWKNVPTATISKCFGKAGFLKNPQQEEGFDKENEIPQNQLIPNIQGISLKNYASID